MSLWALALAVLLAGPALAEPGAEELNNRVLELYAQGKYAEAEKVARRVLQLGEEEHGPVHPDVAQSLNNLAALLQVQGDYGAVLPLYERSLAIYEEILGPDDIELALPLNNLAAFLYARGDYDAALPLYERSLAIYEEALGPDDPSIARPLNNLAQLLEAQGDLDGVRPLYERALRITEGAVGPDHPDVTIALANLASLLQAQGDFEGAQQRLERVLAIRENSLEPNHPDIALGLNNLATLLTERGDFAAARPLLERSLHIREETFGSDHIDVAKSMSNLAWLLSLQGDYEGARPLLERSLAIHRQVLGPDHPDVATAINNLAALARSLHDYETTISLLERALEIAERVLGPDHVSTANSLNNLASVLAESGDTAAALPLYERSLVGWERALGPDHPDVATSLANIGVLLWMQGDNDRARPLLERSLSIQERVLGPDHPMVSKSLGHLAKVLRDQGDPDSARALVERALAIREGRLDLLDTMSEREALAYVVASRKIFDLWLEMFDRQADVERAWSATLRWKGVATRRVRQRLAVSHIDSPTGRDLHERLTATKAELARLTFADFDPEMASTRRDEQLQLTADKEDLERQLGAESAAWGQVREQAAPEEICAALDADTALVDFLRSRGRYLAFVVQAPSCQIRRIDLGEAEPLETQIARWREALGDGESITARVDSRGEAVRDLVWTPLELDGLQRVRVVADGALSALPFGALPLSSGRYLIEELNPSYLENAGDLLRSTEGQHATGALLVGDVDFGEVRAPDNATPTPCVAKNYAPLRGTAVEVDAIAALWGKSRFKREPARQLTSAGASEAAVGDGMAGRRVVHLATHGFFATEDCESASNPMLLSGLVLADANGDHATDDPYDGILTAEELTSVDLRGTELVVLSACQTGLGVVRAGEGVLGLRRAFSAAGVQHLVMSLWSVSDDSTSELMQHFYRRVLQRRGPLPPADAMREAQLDVLEQNRSELGEARPGTWAAFVVSGS